MRRFSYLTLAILGTLTAVLPLRGDDLVWQKTYFVRVGDPAPDFECRDEAGKLWRLKDHVGKKPIVMVFYLGDYFPAPTKRLEGFREYQPHLASLGAEVIGISGDMAETHQNFKSANKLNFPLLADTEAKVAKEYGVYASSGGFTKVKDADGKELRFKRAATFANWTFVIGRDGKVIYKEMNTDPATDSRKVFELLYKLAARR
jgi:peroxiredoxin Q/BCP